MANSDFSGSSVSGLLFLPRARADAASLGSFRDQLRQLPNAAKDPEYQLASRRRCVDGSAMARSIPS